MSGAEMPEGYNPRAEDWASASDRQYFRRHPKRRFRCRAPLPGEFLGLVGCEAVLVVKATEWGRIRTGCSAHWIGAPDKALGPLAVALLAEGVR